MLSEAHGLCCHHHTDATAYTPLVNYCAEKILTRISSIGSAYCLYLYEFLQTNINHVLSVKCIRIEME